VELIIAIILFVAIVGAWIVLPSAPPEKHAGPGAASAKQAGRTA
jgi:hypothetical protein